MSFRTRDFRRRTWHFADMADGYKNLGLSTDEAVDWANRGFTPGEVACQRGRCTDHGYPTAKETR